jgi:cytoskeletal protein RodZ
MATVTTASSGDPWSPDTAPRSTSLGELLRRARERRGLTLERVANETKIPQRHLDALEHDNLTAFPSEFYQRAEIRTYARAVGLDQSIALSQLESALKPAAVVEAPPEMARSHESKLPRAYALIVLGVVAVAAATFGLAISERSPVFRGGSAISGVPDSQPKPVLPILDTSPDVVTSQSEPPTPAAPASSESVTAPTGVVGDAGRRVTMETSETPAAAGAVTELVVTTQPAGARVTVNGIGWGISPVTIRYLPPGDKRIRVIKEGYATEERVLQIGEGQRRALDIELAAAP